MWESLRGLNILTDMDGVLCVDGKPQQPLHIPPCPVVVVTGRSEKYRTVTEDWLQSNGVAYDLLVMMPRETLDLREIARYKAQVYAESDADVFVESCPEQAQIIRESTGREVICWQEHTAP
jgi:hypothetical protein